MFTQSSENTNVDDGSAATFRSIANRSVQTANQMDSSTKQTVSMDGLQAQLAAGCSLGVPATAACEV